jgi:hypothetical protein
MASDPRSGREPDPDADALSWGGESDPTLAAADAPDPELPDGWSVPRGSQAAVPAEPGTDAVSRRSPEATAAAGSFALVGIGILAGIYLLSTIGWFIGVSRVGNPLVDPLGQFMFSLGAWLAVASPVVWFAATYWLTGTRPRARILWLILGAVLLAPLPFVFGAGGIS